MLSSVKIENNGVPIYVQIREQMLRAIGAGQLQPGDQMPTMRQVAVALKIDLNTVRHAYDELAQVNAIVIRPARGTYVAERPPSLDPRKENRRLESFTQQVLAMAAAAGIEPNDLSRSITQLSKNKGAKS